MSDSDSNNTQATRIKSIIDRMNAISNVSIEGAWIVLETQPENFSLSQMAHLVEQNGAQITNLFTYSDEETAKTFVGFRIDLEDASKIIRGLERFNLPVSYCFQRQGLTDEIMKSRLDELMYYLEM